MVRVVDIQIWGISGGNMGVQQCEDLALKLWPDQAVPMLRTETGFLTPLSLMYFIFPLNIIIYPHLLLLTYA